MNAAERRMEIISILICKHHVTARELAWEFDVSIHTILNDIRAMSFGYPIYTKAGAGGGIFIMDSYKPYNNTLTLLELKSLQRVYETVKEEDRKIILQVIRKYGPDKLEI